MMVRGDAGPIVASLFATLVGAGVAWAGSQGSTTVATMPVFGLAVALAFIVQWLVFVPSFLRCTETFFDLTGSLTYMGVMSTAVLLSQASDPRSMLLFTLVVVWAARLGTFLFRRVRAAGKDGRFDEIKGSAARFFMTWTLQGLWVSLTLAAALAAVTSQTRPELDGFALVGLLVWIVGFSIEAIADAQKTRFRADPANHGAFITTGLWSWSRHPNYFGEIVLWAGIALIAFPALSGWQYITLVSPVFVALLLTRVSGIPLLEKRSDERWGGEPDYEAYKQRTPILVPRSPRG